MFKPGDSAKVKSDGRIVTVESGAPSGGKWPVVTSAGTFEETELVQAHPSVLEAAKARSHSENLIEQVRQDISAGADSKMSFELRGELEEALQKMSMDFNGHWKNGKALTEFSRYLRYVTRNCMSAQEAQDLVQAHKDNKPLNEWVSLDGLGLGSSLRSCSHCGESYFSLETNGISIRISGEPCKFANGMPLTEWELNVPSGKLVVANDLRRIFPLEDDRFNVNELIGCRQTALAYAENGMAHAFVGNTCPGVYKCGDGLFKIANEPYEDADPRPPFEGERVAGICTDLWWYSICDHNEFKKRLKHFKRKASEFNVGIVNVKPGVYRFRHNEEARAYEGPGECIYTHFEWMREPDPVVDYIAKYENVEVNPNSYVHSLVDKYPTLYGNVVNEHAWHRMADSVFCTLGSGVEWHPKGFPTARVDESIPDVEPPSFRAQHFWYPFAEPYGGLFEPQKLSPSFAKLAFRVLESIISFGIHVHESDGKRDVREVRSRMLIAVKKYREFAQKYPDQADPEYVAWLSQKNRAETWVKNFDLGPESTK